MLESPNAVRQSPPPLPKSPSPLPKAPPALPRRGLASTARQVRDWARRRPALVAAVLAGALLSVAAGAAIALRLHPGPSAPPTVASARADASAHPEDAAAQRDLGHALWASRKRAAALRAYERALALDAGAADAQLVSHLLASFGGRLQHDAETLLWKHQLVSAEEGLKRLVRSRSHSVRWGAVRTLDRLGKGSKADWETAYIADLDSPRCEVRRVAVEKLGAIGTRRAVAALREARADDARTGGLFRSRCLGERLDQAEQRILARR
jgi:hypothetical protein